VQRVAETVTSKKLEEIGGSDVWIRTDWHVGGDLLDYLYREATVTKKAIIQHDELQRKNRT
jgi:hypothetical protein